MPLFKLLSRRRDESVGIFNSGLLSKRLKLKRTNFSPIKKKKNRKRDRDSRYRFEIFPILSSLQNRTGYTRVYAKLAISVVASPPISRYIPPNRSFRESYLRKFRKYTTTKRNIEISRGSAGGGDRRRETAPPRLGRIYLAAIYILRKNLSFRIFFTK